MFWLIQPLFFAVSYIIQQFKLRIMLLPNLGSILISFKLNLSSWQIKCVKFIYSNNIYVFLPFLFNAPWKFLDFITSYFFIPCFFLVMTFTSSSCTQCSYLDFVDWILLVDMLAAYIYISFLASMPRLQWKVIKSLPFLWYAKYASRKHE